MTTNSNNTSGIRVESRNSITRINASSDAFIYYTNLSKDWATKINGTVDGEEYSSKYYAQQAYQSYQDASGAYDDAVDYISEIQANFRQGIGLIKEDESNAIKGSAAGIYVDLSDLESDISDLETDVDSIETNIGNLSNLTTDVKSSLVLAINEHETLLNQKVNNSVIQGAKWVIGTYVNGTSWYRVWSDGWCEQGGLCSVHNIQTITFLKTYANTNYSIMLTQMSLSGSRVTSSENNQVITKTTSNFKAYINDTSNVGAYWKTCGYLAEGEY